ncbi:unnamed protein product [Cylindrotheca closterium]|uniref:Uncharacterized protein n=1 Tax=Cylindrotheca closterium TaxID=2856 RepID=A0AAD2G280_9STRA|nr:unnamed protein product [Cylindrotheca closterium]
MSSMGYRSTTVKGLKQQLKAPEEDGTEQDLEDFFRSLTDKVIIRWADGGDVGYVLEENAEPEIKEPDPLTAAEEADARKVKAYDRLMDKYEDQKDAFRANTVAMFQLIMSNVTRTMRNKIKSTDGHLAASKNKDMVWLMSTIEDIVSGYEEGFAPAELALDDALEQIFKMRQKGSESNEAFVKTTMLRAIKAYEGRGGPFLWTPAKEKELKTAVEAAKSKFTAASATGTDVMTTEQEDDVRRFKKKMIKDRSIAMSILKRTNKERFGDLMKELSNHYLKKPNGTPQDGFPKDVPGVLKLLENWKPNDVARRGCGNNNNSARQPSARTEANRNPLVSFAQTAGETGQVYFFRGTNGLFYACRLC